MLVSSRILLLESLELESLVSSSRCQYSHASSPHYWVRDHRLSSKRCIQVVLGLDPQEKWCSVRNGCTVWNDDIAKLNPGLWVVLFHCMDYFLPSLSPYCVVSLHCTGLFPSLSIWYTLGGYVTLSVALCGDTFTHCLIGLITSLRRVISFPLCQ